MFKGNRKAIEQNAFDLRDDIELFAYVAGKRLRVEVSNYKPEPPESWDVDKWEERKAVLSAPADRWHWKRLYQLARTLSQRGEALVDFGNGPETLLLGGGLMVIEL